MDTATAPLAALSDADFLRIQAFMYRHAGINLSPAKKALVSGRLQKRLRQRGLNGYGEYFRLVESGREPAETQVAVDLLTTNETYFFRELKHFEFLRDKVLPRLEPGRPCRVWSAACSSGEEPYSIAMLLADRLGSRPWEVLASDISSRVLATARTGHYPMSRGELIPKPYYSRFCLKGVGRQEGTFLVDKTLRARVRFFTANLNQALPKLGEFDVIFLRNVMIYFDAATKLEVVRRLTPLLTVGGYLFTGHSESLHGMDIDLKQVQPAIYRRK